MGWDVMASISSVQWGDVEYVLLLFRVKEIALDSGGVFGRGIESSF